jgi:hypothetical protein
MYEQEMMGKMIFERPLVASRNLMPQYTQDFVRAPGPGFRTLAATEAKMEELPERKTER